MQVREWFWLENLLSVSRVALAPVAWYFLSQPGLSMLVIAVAIIAVAGITDGLDGIVARRRKQSGSLGLVLDPVSDKIFAGVMVLALIVTRDFPVWAAAVIIGRDIIILGAAVVLLGKSHVPPHSNLSGKYAFSSIIVLLASYVLRFPFGQILMLVIAMSLIALSLTTYARAFVAIRNGQIPREFSDSATWRLLRKLAIAVIAAIYFVAFFVHFGEWREQWTTGGLLRQSAGVYGQTFDDPLTIDNIHS